MSATVNAFIYDTFLKLMASHVVTLRAENVQRYIHFESDQSCSLVN